MRSQIAISGFQCNFAVGLLKAIALNRLMTTSNVSNLSQETSLINKSRVELFPYLIPYQIGQKRI